MDRIGGIGNEHDVSRPDRHQDEVREALLGPDHRHGFGRRIEVDVMATLVPLGDARAQIGQPLRRGVAVVARITGGLADLVDDVRGGRQIGVAHAEIDDVLTGAAARARQLRHLGKDVRR